jgi:peptidoglycan hydrolase CwlO-like protein
MFTEKEQNYFEQLLNAKFENIENKLDTIHHEVKKTNGRVNRHDDEIDKMQQWIAETKGRNAAMMLLGSILAVVLGWIIGLFEINV